MILRISALAMVMASVIVSMVVFVSVEMFRADGTGFPGLNPAEGIFLVPPLAGALGLGLCAKRNGSARLMVVVASLPLVCQVLIFFVVVRTGWLA